MGFVLSAVPTLAAHVDLPVVRNGLIYARIADFMLEYGRDFSVAEHAYNKALGFPVLSLPMVAAFGGNLGVKLSSFLWTALWVVSIVFFLKHLERVFNWNDGAAPSTALCLAVFFVNPLVYYQFESAYPDSLNALAFLWSLYFLERATSRTASQWDGPAFFALLVVSIWIKHHGFVLFALLAAFAACRASNLAWQWRSRRRVLTASAVALAASLTIVGLAQSGYLELFNLSQNRGNYSGGFDRIGPIVRKNLDQFEIYVWVSFTFLFPLLLRWKSVWKYREWYLSIGVFIATILVYKGARYNIRYYLPVAPLLVWIACNNLARLPRPLAGVLLGAFLLSNGFFTLYYNNIAVARAVDRVHAFRYRDNLRLINEQRFRNNDIRAINDHVAPHRNVLFLTLPYYHGAAFYIWERAGLFAPGLTIQYLHEPDWNFIDRYAKQQGLSQALYYGQVTRAAREKWGSRISWQQLTRMSFVLTFR